MFYPWTSTTPRRRPAARAEALAWLETVAKLRGEGDGDWRAFRARTDEEDAAQLERGKAWQRTKCDAGWAAIHWPVEYGGQGRTAIEAGVFAEEESRFDTTGNMFMIGIDMVGPTLIAHGTQEQKARFLPAMLRGDEVWCQLFSEPGAGSDLACALHAGRPRRRRVGDRRAEGVDLVGAHRRLGHVPGPHRPGRAEARRHHLLPRRHAHARA